MGEGDKPKYEGKGKSFHEKMRLLGSSPSWWQGPKAYREKSSAENFDPQKFKANMRTAIEFAVVPPIFKALGGIAKGSKLLGGITKFADKLGVSGGITKFADKFASKLKWDPQKMMPTLTSKGVRNIRADKFKGVQVYRTEDAYIGSKGYKIKQYSGSGTTTHNWWTKRFGDMEETYIPHVKDALMQGRSQTKTFYLPPGSSKRGMVVNLSNKMFKRFQRPLFDPTTTANRLSGGVNRGINFNEIIIPGKITDKIRKGEVSYATVFSARTSKELIKKFEQTQGFGL